MYYISHILYYIIYNIYNKHHPSHPFTPHPFPKQPLLTVISFRKAYLAREAHLTLLSSNPLRHLSHLPPPPSSLYRYKSSSVSPTHYYAFTPINVPPLPHTFLYLMAVAMVQHPQHRHRLTIPLILQPIMIRFTMYKRYCHS